MPRWPTPAHKLGTVQWSRHRLVLADGRLLEWSEQHRSTGRPLLVIGYLDGRSIDDDELAGLVGTQRRSSDPPSAA